MEHNGAEEVDSMAGRAIVNKEQGRCTNVSQVRVTSAGACQTTYRWTKVESHAGRDEASWTAAAPLLH